MFFLIIWKEILKFFPEIFKDLTLSAHFLYCSTNNVSQIILRRILEIGISVIYLWDQPYIYLKWKKLDEHIADLSFKEMIDHLNDVGYVEFVNIENSSEINQGFIGRSTEVHKESYRIPWGP